MIGLFRDRGHFFYNYGEEGLSHRLEKQLPVFNNMILENPQGLGVAAALKNYTAATGILPHARDSRWLDQILVLDIQKEAQKKWKSNAGRETNAAAFELYGR